MPIRKWLVLVGLAALVGCAEDIDLVAPDVTLTASSTVVDQGEPVTLSWEVLGTEPMTVTLEPAQDLPLTSPLTVTPTETTAYTLTATNAAGSDSSTVTVNVNIPELPVPGPTPATIETFTSERSDAPLGITLRWVLDGTEAATCSVDVGDGSAPRTIDNCRTTEQFDHSYTQAGTYTVTLRLDSGLSQSLTVQVGNVVTPPANRAPVVTTGEDVDARVGEVVTLTGQATDEDGDDLSFVWNLVDRPDTSRAELTDADTLTTIFTADVSGAYVLRLTVSDGTVSVTDELTVRVLPADAQVVNSVRIVALEDLQLTEGTSQTVQLERWGTTRDRLIVRVQLITPDPTSTEDIVLEGANLVDGVYRVLFETLRSRTTITLRVPEDDLEEGLERARLVILENDAYDLVSPSELAIAINDADAVPQPPTPNLRVCQGDIVASSQADVETLRGCTSVTGGLSINPLGTSTLNSQHSRQPSSKQGDAITSLAPLSDLEYVAGGLAIANTNITSLEGLGNLTLLESDRFATTLAIINNDALTSLQGLNPELRLEHNLRIQDNDMLPDLQGLEAISVLVELEIEDNLALQSLQGLDNLEVVRAALQVRNNPQLTNMAGLDNLREVDGIVIISDNAGLANLTGLDNLRSVDSGITIYQNDVLTSLEGLNNVTLVGVTLSVEGNPSLTSLAGLDALRSIGIIRIEDNDQLVSLAGMLSLRDMGGSLTIAENDALTSLMGLEMLRTAASLDIRNNALLTSLTGLENMQTLAGLGIQDNASLQSLQGLTSLSRIDGLVSIVNNDSLRSLTGLDALVSIGPDIESRSTTQKATSQNRLVIPPIWIDPPPAGSYFNVIADNDVLTSFVGLETLEFIDEGLEIANNARLTSLAGLDNLKTIDGTLNITSNPQLVTLAAAPNLSTINFDLNVDTNASLTSLEGLNGLTRIGQQLRIVNNPALTTLAGLTVLQTVVSDMTITNNQLLMTLEGLETITNYDESNFVTVSFNPVLDCAALNLPFTVDLSTGNLTSCRTGDTARICEGDYNITQQVAELAALADCEEITGSLTVGADPFRPEDGITSLAPLTNLQTVGGTLRIIGNSALPSLEGLDNLRSVGSLVIDNNTLIQNLTPLVNLTTINRDLRINRTNVTSLAGLEGVTSLVNLSLVSNSDLTTLDRLRLEQVTGGIRVESNAALASLLGLDRLSTVGDSLRILENGSLTSLDGLANIETIGDNLELDQNAITSLANLGSLTSVSGNFVLGANALTSLDGLSNLAQVGGRLEVEGGSITTLTGLDNLSQVGSLQIYSRNLVSLASLDSLTTVLGDVTLTSNNALETLTGLENLTTIAGELVLFDNAALSSLTALTSLTTVGEDIFIGRTELMQIPGNNQLRSLAGLENITNYDDTNTVIISFNRNLDCTPPPALPFVVDESTGNAVNCVTD